MVPDEQRGRPERPEPGRGRQPARARGAAGAGGAARQGRPTPSRGSAPRTASSSGEGQGGGGHPGRRAPEHSRPRERARRLDSSPPPPLPDQVTADQLDPDVRRELRSLSKDRADEVARHLVQAGLLLDDDPQLALRHARAARSGGARVASVREAAGVVAYAAGEWAEALSELRTYRRMTGSVEHLALMADAQRGLGRPAKALEVLDDPEVSRVPSAARIELLLVASGALRDLGRADEAVEILSVRELDSPSVRPETARLWYGYADALLAAGRRDAAIEWFEAVASADDDRTDAVERLESLGAGAGVRLFEEAGGTGEAGSRECADEHETGDS